MTKGDLIFWASLAVILPSLMYMNHKLSLSRNERHYDDVNWRQCMQSINSAGGATFLGRSVGAGVTNIGAWKGIIAVRHKQINLFKLCRCIRGYTVTQCYPMLDEEEEGEGTAFEGIRL